MQVILKIILLFWIVNCFGNTKYDLIDKNSKSVPDTLKSAVEIAHYLTKDLTKEDEKVRAIHIWITHNIQYDFDLLEINQEYTSYNKMIEHTLESKKGVCDNYSQLFQGMCQSVGIKSYIIAGYTRERNSDEVPKISHAWNAVKVDNEYFFVDNTWASGYLNYKNQYVHEFIDEYFLIPPKDFIKTHIPFDPIWQFLNNPISHTEIKNNDFSRLQLKGNFNYVDSIRTSESLDSIPRFIKKGIRIRKSGISNRLIKNYLGQVEQQIENLNYNEWTRVYNILADAANNAKDEVNMAISLNNRFIVHMNKRFRRPKIEDEEIKTLIENTNEHFNNGQKGFKKTRLSLHKLQFEGTNEQNLILIEKKQNELKDFLSELGYKIEEVRSSISKNSDFSERYFKKWKPLRDFVPY